MSRITVGARHPLCTCPDLTWVNFATLDRSTCRGGRIAHPVLTGEEAQTLINELHGQTTTTEATR